MQNKKFTIIAVIAIAIVGSTLYYFSVGGLLPSKKINVTPENKPRVITEENLVIPKTEKISDAEGKQTNFGSANAVEVLLVPKNEGEKMIVLKAILTVKGSYDLAQPEAVKWASDAQLVFIKSLGAITLDGKSSQWQLAFFSPAKKGKGYEIIIQADQITSKREIASTAKSDNFPKNWYDSDGAIKSIQTMPQFTNATISFISFTYDPDSQGWLYVLANSDGQTTSMPVR